jgi:predicted transposase/invertase (TIGR01784 family)
MQRNDSLWKGILEETFEDFLRFLVPEADTIFDFSKRVEYLDKELEQLFPLEGSAVKVKYVDKLVKVYTREGAEEWVLVHVEVQGYPDGLFAKRMFQYYTRIWDKYDRSITAFAVYTDANRGFHSTRFEQSFLGTSLSYRFNTFMIMDQSEAELAESENPFAMVALAAKTSVLGQRMKETDLYALKISIVKILIIKKIDKDKIRVVMDFIKAYISFDNHDLEDNFDKEIAVLTGNDQATMGIREQILQQAENRGLEKGMEILIKGLLSNNPSLDTKKNIIKTLLAQNFTIEQIEEITEFTREIILTVKEEQDRA